MDLSSIFRFSDMVEYFPKILSRFPVTLLIVVVSVAGGLVLGFILAAARIFKIPVLKELAALYISFVRGTPILVQLFVVYYGLPLLVAPLGVDINHWSKLFFVLVTYLLNDGAFMSEIIRSSIESVPKGQLEAAASVGLTTFQTYKRIIIPQAFKIAAPAFGTRVVGSFQATAMAFTLGIIDIMGQVKAIGTRTNRVLEGYVDAAIIFIIVSYLLERLFTWMEHRLNGPFEFSYVFTVIGKIWEAMPVTLLLTFAPLFIGFLFGVPFAVIRRFNVPFAASFLKNASNILKGIPAVLLVLMINYLILKPIDYLALSYEWAKPLQTMNKIYIGIAALSIYAVVQITETVLGALLSVGKGQYEAAYSIGLTRTKTLFRVVFPQAVPAALPVLCNNVIGLLKSTSIVYLISVNDILGAAINSAAVNFRYLEAYIAVAVVYWAMCVCVEKLFYVMEKRYKYAAGGKI